MIENRIVFNAIPEKSSIHKRIAPFKRGDVKTYRLAGSYNPTTKKYYLRDLYLPTTDVISDDEGNTYEIALIESTDAFGVIKFADVLFAAGGLCTIVLHGGRARDKKIYDFIERSNFLINNEDRDTTITGLIERVEPDMDGGSARKTRAAKKEAFLVVDNLTDEEITSYLKSNDLFVPSTAQGRKDAIEDFIDEGQGANKFLRANIGGAGKKVSDFTKLIDDYKKKELIAFDKSTGVWSLRGGEMICQIKKGASSVGELVKVLSGKDGDEWIAKIEA